MLPIANFRRQLVALPSATWCHRTACGAHHNEAIVNVERDRRYTHWDYHLLTNRIAKALQGALGIDAGDKFMLILENDSLSLMALPMVVKQAGTVVLSNLRDSIEEHRWQIELVKPRVCGHIDPPSNRIPRLLGDFELDRPPSFLLDHHGSGPDTATHRNVVDL